MTSTRTSLARPILVLFVLPLCASCLCKEASAAQSDLKSPYKLQVVLHVGDSRLLTPVFQERVERGLHDYLQAAFLGLANVEIVRTHPKLPEVLDKGLQKALDNWKELSSVKTHFVLINYAGADYEIESRQHDGFTGQASPIVRTDRTRDREFVARVAALMVEKDFGILGEFDRWPTPQPGQSPEPPLLVNIRLKDNGMGPALGRWVEKGDIFNIVRASGGGRESRSVGGAYLRVVELPGADGTCPCQLYWRFERKGADPGGYRVMKLHTLRAPLRLRVTQRSETGGAAPPGVFQIEVRRNNFTETNVLKGSTDVTGYYDTAAAKAEGIFDRLALVRLVRNLADVARVPVPLVDDQPVVVTLHAVSDESGLAGFRRMSWKRDVAQSYGTLENLFQELSKKTSDPKTRKESLQQAREGLRQAQADYTRLNEERKQLLQEAPMRAAEEKLLAYETSLLQRLHAGEQTLREFIEKQQTILNEETDPERLALLAEVERGKVLEKGLEYGQAIAIYEKALGNPKLKIDGLAQHVEKLKQEWAVKSPEHETARTFIYETFPKFDTAALEAKIVPGKDGPRMPEAEKALETAMEAGDTVTPRRLQVAIDAHLARMIKEASTLKPDTNPDDEAQLKTIAKVKSALESLSRAIK